MEFLHLDSPKGTAWELLVVMIVIVAAPIIVQKFRVPGLIGLLAGGCLIGPQVLGVVSDTTGVVHELGEVGLVYLMFLAGLELDLAVFARFRKQAIGFMALTFLIPQLLGTAGGFLVGYDVAGSVLLGSLFASYTLVAYPIVRGMGLAANRAVAATVGATVLTDTLALVILAFISGSADGDAGGVELILQVVFGLAILLAYSFLVLPRLATWFFRSFGRSRILKYGFVFGALLSAAVVAEVVGIEGIVGAFFCGLALNRLVPNEGEFMERIEFFGSALLIPTFLVSIGTVIDPKVLVDPATLGLAAVFLVACIGGKLIAALLCRPLFGYTGAEVGVTFGLSVAQAAATLAATFVGLRVGLFTTSTVNAVMIVVVVSLVLASVFSTRYGVRLPVPPVDASRIGRFVVAKIAGADHTDAVLDVAASIAQTDVGVVRPVHILTDDGASASDDTRATVERSITRLSLDADLEVRYDLNAGAGVLHAASSFAASIIVAPATSTTSLPTLQRAGDRSFVVASNVPVVLVRAGVERWERVVLTLSSAHCRQPDSACLLSVTVAQRLRSNGRTLVVVSDTDLHPSMDDLLHKATRVVESPERWLEREGREDDLVVVSGGRNGALSAARITRSATPTGATIVSVADRTSILETASVDGD
ncbi:cation:proton antiporter [Ilumatobacter sp.]|uniref:cation:proton antiporter n=1 Tax=Ilumatobacter sp. TaxID=1967498 RepID=UPI003C352D7D